MKNEMRDNIKTAITVSCSGIGSLTCVSIIKKIHNQALPQIKEATGGKKAWFIAVTVFTELMYIGFAIGTAMGAVLAIKERIADHKLQRELEACPLDFMETGSEEDKDSSEDNKKIKRCMEKWSSIRDDDQIVMPR